MAMPAMQIASENKDIIGALAVFFVSLPARPNVGNLAAIVLRIMVS
jgi:hypothetical protein